MARFEQWLGRPVDNLLAFVGHQDWADFPGGARWAAEDIYSGIDRSVIWSVPLIVEGANLGDAADGDYNGYYREAAEALAAAMARLIGARHFAARCAARMRSLALAMPDWTEIARMTTAVYAGAIAARHDARRVA